jgi:hypothetical protein
MELKPCSLNDLSTAKVNFAAGSLPSTPYAEVLVIAFIGKAGNSHEFCGTFNFMDAMIAAGVVAWHPFAVVLDLRQLSYAWGDEMQGTLGSAYDYVSGSSLPTSVVVSDLNRKGLTSLVIQEMFASPGDWLFETVEDAIAAVDRRVDAQRRNRGLGGLLG